MSKTFYNLIFFLSIVIPTLATAQNAADSVVMDYRQSESSLVLLKNEQQLLPLQKLDTTRLVYFGSGLESNSIFEQTLRKYTVVEDFAAYWSYANQETQTPPTFILGIQAIQNNEKVINGLLATHPCIVVLFDTTNLVQFLPNLRKAKALIHAPSTSTFTQSLAAQVIFGGTGAKGRLQQDWSPDFRAGSGLDLPSGTRLGYAPAALVGFDTKKLETGIETIVQEGLDIQAYPGAQVLVIKDNKVVYHKTFGYHTYEQRQPVTTDDIYDFASITKISASLPAVMRLYGEGRLNIDAPLGSIYPFFKNSNKKDLTLRPILAHQARLLAWIPFWRGTLEGNARYPWKKKWNGLMNNTGDFKSRTFAPDSSARYPVKVTENMWLHRRYEKEIYKAIKRSPLNEKPGYVYSDLSFYLYPKMLPPIIGKDFETYLKETFYRPLGAYTLTFNAWKHFPMSRIVPTENDTFFRKTILHGYVHDEGAGMLNGLSGHAGLFGSAGDLAKLMQMYLNGGTYGGEQFLKKEVLDEFKRCAYCNEGNHRGLGFDKPLIQYNPKSASYAQSASPESYGHSGYTGTFTWTDPKYNLIYIFFCNRVHPTRDNRKLLDRSIRPRVQQAIYDALLPEAMGAKQ
ncbi:MAG: serine hydrolase domain-containing protein [Saprospiraceae bacterium]